MRLLALRRRRRCCCRCSRRAATRAAQAEFWELFVDTGTIGRGHFAKVKQIRHAATGDQFAAKILDKTKPDNRVGDMARARPPSPLRAGGLGRPPSPATEGR